MLLAFDVGNSNIVLGVFKDGELITNWRLETNVRKSADEYGMIVNQLFEYEGLKTADVADVIISKNTLNGEYITRFYPQASELDTIITSDAHSAKYIIDSVNRNGSKKAQYKLGTIVKNGEYFLLAFTHFDKDNRAFLEINDYMDCLMNMWNECDIHYGGSTVVLPLLGSGITRFRGYENITDQELLEIIIWTFKASRIRFQYPAKVKIILTKDCLSKINMYDIMKRYEQ